MPLALVVAKFLDGRPKCDKFAKQLREEEEDDEVPDVTVEQVLQKYAKKKLDHDGPVNALASVAAYLAEKGFEKATKRLRSDDEGKDDVVLEDAWEWYVKKAEKKAQKEADKKAAQRKTPRTPEVKMPTERHKLISAPTPMRTTPGASSVDTPATDEKRRSFNQREDWDKWTNAVADGAGDRRLWDRNYRTGDSWGNKAAADLGKVRGKDFKREMQKKKRASWRGGGTIDQGVNSVFFHNSSDEDE